jgi:hypothetical protein
VLAAVKKRLRSASSPVTTPARAMVAIRKPDHEGAEVAVAT